MENQSGDPYNLWTLSCGSPINPKPKPEDVQVTLSTLVCPRHPETPLELNLLKPPRPKTPLQRKGRGGPRDQMLNLLKPPSLV